MNDANPRKTLNRFVSNHLIATAHQAIRETSQTVVARLLDVHDSTIMRRTEKLSDCCEVLAAAGIKDFVLPGEKKISEEEYRFMWKQIAEFSLLKTGGFHESNAIHQEEHH